MVEVEKQQIEIISQGKTLKVGFRNYTEEAAKKIYKQTLVDSVRLMAANPKLMIRPTVPIQTASHGGQFFIIVAEGTEDAHKILTERIEKLSLEP